MAAKTLSTSTLSLKFMQNAHRAKNLAEVQLERAEVKDDGEWEVAKEIRDAWGPETTQAVSYEASYLPFLFTSDASEPDATPAVNLKGRRAFKRGREVADEYQPIVPAAPTPPAASTSKSAGKPKQISSVSGRTGSSNSNAKNSPKGKSARQAIYDSSGVGSDMRAKKTETGAGARGSTGTPAPSKAPLPNVFLKPAGVDEPAESTKSASALSTTKTSPPSSEKTKGKRERERTGTAEIAEGENSSKKRKRKKKNDQAGAAE
ncbi:hypothetical protein C8R47DRAFT_422710 [Mycena vitilis]|nr:hypothetical protein C8R47DRAFT_422710 [Mycena vitilis]